MKLIQIIKRHFSLPERMVRKELRRAARFESRKASMEATYNYLVRRKVLQKLRTEIKEHKSVARDTRVVDGVATIGGVVIGWLDHMARNYHYNSRPLRRHRRRYLVDIPMAFAVMSTGRRR